MGCHQIRKPDKIKVDYHYCCMKFPKTQNPWKIPIHLSIIRFICQSIRQLPHFHMLKTCHNSPVNMGRKCVNYRHEILVKSPSVHTSCIAFVVAPICASSVLSIHLSNDEHQEIPDKFPSTNYGEKTHPKS